MLADRGLYAHWLFEAIRRNGWHPFLRINGCASKLARSESQPLIG